MSNRTLAFALAVATALLCAATPATAQSVAELRAQTEAMRVRRNESYERMRAAELKARDVPDDSLVLSGTVVRFRSERLASRDRAALARAFENAAAELNATFGSNGSSLLTHDQWLLSFTSARRVVLESTRNVRVAVPLRVPLRTSDVQHLVVTRAVTALVEQAPVFGAWIGGTFEIADVERTHYFSYRQLVFHATEAGQRCARGVAADCSASLGVGTARSQLRYAVERDGAAILELLQRTPAPTARPTTAIAAALGESESAFLTAWHARVAASGAVKAAGSPGLLLTSLGWCALCALAAARRRPR